MDSNPKLHANSNNRKGGNPRIHENKPRFQANVEPKSSEMDKVIRRGDVYYIDFDPVTGSEQGGIRPAVVIQNDVGNKFSPVVIVAVMTTQTKNGKILPTHVYVDKEDGVVKDSTVLLEQIKTVDKTRLRDYQTTLPSSTMERVTYALSVSLGMDKISSIMRNSRIA